MDQPSKKIEPQLRWPSAKAWSNAYSKNSTSLTSKTSSSTIWTNYKAETFKASPKSSKECHSKRIYFLDHKLDHTPKYYRQTTRNIVPSLQDELRIFSFWIMPLPSGAKFYRRIVWERSEGWVTLAQIITCLKFRQIGQ